MARAGRHGQISCTAQIDEEPEVARWNGADGLMLDLAASTELDRKESCQSPGTFHSPRSHLTPHGNNTNPSLFGLSQMLLLVVFLLIQPSAAVFINYRNCLGPGIINSSPQTLQFQPLYVWATFNSSAPSHDINVTAYGNVTGIATNQTYPSVDDPQWKDPNKTLGKIPDVGGQGAQAKYTTFTTQFNVLDYTPYDPPAVRFCNSSALTQCPLAPVFNFTGNA